MNDSAGKFCADKRMGKREQDAKTSPRPTPTGAIPKGHTVNRAPTLGQ